MMHNSDTTTTEVDVVICGSGSAGLCVAAWLARCGLECTVLESSGGPLQVGQADGVQCRTVEIFESFQLSDELLRESYHVNEVCFWGRGGGGKADSENESIARTGRASDTPTGLSHMPHVILNQARINSLLIGAMTRWNGQDILYGYTVTSVAVDADVKDDPSAHAVMVMAVKGGQEARFKAKYVLVSALYMARHGDYPSSRITDELTSHACMQGCDGAHSVVRKSLGYRMLGDSTDSVWGVMDVYARTNFPDIRKKVVIRSPQGSLLIIPREGDSLVRLYIELPAGTVAKTVCLGDLMTTARRILAQYMFEVVETLWWSAYSIGQRLADHFCKDNRVFLTGDSCHTHSPKAGQGMNVSLQDGYNIGWKLAHVLHGLASPELLCTYSLERGKVAADLIAFDRQFSKRFSSKSNDGVSDTNAAKPQAFDDYFQKSARYTAGLTATYGESAITSADKSTQSLAARIIVGMRFPSAQVLRFSDSRAQQFLRALSSDGRWRVVLFAGDVDADRQLVLARLRRMAGGLTETIQMVTRKEEDADHVVEVLVVFKGDRTAIEMTDLPDFYRPINGKWRMQGMSSVMGSTKCTGDSSDPGVDPHKIFFDDESHNHGHGRAYEAYGIDPAQGVLVVVRPDQCKFHRPRPMDHETHY